MNGAGYRIPGRMYYVDHVMRVLLPRLNAVVAAAILAMAGMAPASSQTTAPEGRVAELLERLAQPDLEHWQRIERRILDAWSSSGSPTIDLLLRRGRAALEEGDSEAAIAHLTALTDHAPEFAEGWHARAKAYYSADLLGPAMSDLARALALNPHHFGALSGLGAILEDVGRERQALEAFRAAAAIHPHQPRIRAAVERLTRRVAGLDA